MGQQIRAAISQQPFNGCRAEEGRVLVQHDIHNFRKMRLTRPPHMVIQKKRGCRFDIQGFRHFREEEAVDDGQLHQLIDPG